MEKEPDTLFLAVNFPVFLMIPTQILVLQGFLRSKSGGARAPARQQPGWSRCRTTLDHFGAIHKNP
jgi:hypothetical protein